MLKTKRRLRNEPSTETHPEAPADRQTRVTLTRDVSSRYRKIMPKSPAGPTSAGRAGRWPQPANDEGDVAAPRPKIGRPKTGYPKTRPPKTDYPTTGRLPKTGRPRTARAEEDQPPREPERYADGSRPAGPGRYPATKTSRPGPGRYPATKTSRPGPGRYSTAKRGREGLGAAKGPEGPSEAMKALVNRELPEAAKQIREIQGLLRTAADGLLAKLEELDGRHRALAETAARLEEDAADGEALAEGVRQARAAGAALFEKISFQDLAGQRLTKVENFLKALGILVGPGPATRGPAGKVKKKSGGSRLKGPQAAGGGLDQGHIDALLTGRTF